MGLIDQKDIDHVVRLTKMKLLREFDEAIIALKLECKNFTPDQISFEQVNYRLNALDSVQVKLLELRNKHLR